MCAFPEWPLGASIHVAPVCAYHAVFSELEGVIGCVRHSTRYLGLARSDSPFSPSMGRKDRVEMPTSGSAGDRPFGVPLDTIQSRLMERGYDCTRVGSGLLVENDQFKSTLEVSAAEQREAQQPPIVAVVRIRTEIHDPVIRLMQGSAPDWAAKANLMSTLGALMEDGESIVVGSRLAVFDGENVWDELHVPLIVSSLQWAADSICGAWLKTMTREPPVGGTSAWSEEDLSALQSHMSRVSVCNSSGVTFSAEFGLERGAMSAVVGDTNTALLSMRRNEPHPHLGGGLYVLMRMPHKLFEPKQIAKACEHLNRLEMDDSDVPPHFGAWRDGPAGLGVAYTAFLPNELRSVPGIALNVATWSLHRAHWANAELLALGHTA
jgi:hypothetical protein